MLEIGLDIFKQMNNFFQHYCKNTMQQATHIATLTPNYFGNQILSGVQLGSQRTQDGN